ncbi:MAG TPA: hypothetical protein VFQ93_15260 [Casimicrobiaceae bacterium]|nr:hypothetical protein [Casimicrobiaceae bacterium]
MANLRILVAPRLLARSDEALATLRPLARLATYARDVARSRDLSSALFAALGMRPDTPVAPLALLGRGGDPGDDYVICAEPVHLEAGSGHALDVAIVSDLDSADADNLVQMLDRHFAADDVRFEPGCGTPWLARRAEASDVAMTTPEAAHGTMLAESLPRGRDAVRWRRWQDEIAMLLHDHSVNRIREAGSLATVNAIWFFGGARLRDVGEVPQVVAGDAKGLVGDVVRGLARLGAERCRAARQATTSTRADGTSRNARFVVDVAEAGTEDAALARALADLEASHVDAVHLVAGGRTGAIITWRIPAPGAWRRIAARVKPRTLHVPTMDGRAPRRPHR